MNFTYSYAAQTSPQLVCRMYAVSGKLTKWHQFEVEHFGPFRPLKMHSVLITLSTMIRAYYFCYFKRECSWACCLLVIEDWRLYSNFSSQKRPSLFVCLTQISPAEQWRATRVSYINFCDLNVRLSECLLGSLVIYVKAFLKINVDNKKQWLCYTWRTHKCTSFKFK